MATSKPKRKSERPSRGTIIAAKARAKLNSATDAERSALFARGMQLIYGHGQAAKATLGSR
jgi:hypothetical protein